MALGQRQVNPGEFCWHRSLCWTSHKKQTWSLHGSSSKAWTRRCVGFVRFELFGFGFPWTVPDQVKTSELQLPWEGCFTSYTPTSKYSIAVKSWTLCHYEPTKLETEHEQPFKPWSTNILFVSHHHVVCVGYASIFWVSRIKSLKSRTNIVGVEICAIKTSYHDVLYLLSFMKLYFCNFKLCCSLARSSHGSGMALWDTYGSDASHAHGTLD